MNKFWMRQHRNRLDRDRLKALKDEFQIHTKRLEPTEALRVVRELGRRDALQPRWPHAEGDLLCRLGGNAAAAVAYAEAARLYAEAGFPKRSAAVAKKLLLLDPSRLDVLAIADPCEAARMQVLYGASSMRPYKHPSILPEDPLGSTSTGIELPLVALEE